MGKITADNAELGIAVFPRDVGDATSQALTGPQPMQFLTGWDKMKVGQMYECQHFKLSCLLTEICSG